MVDDANRASVQRRSLLKYAGTALTAGITAGIAGCTGSGSGGSSDDYPSGDLTYIVPFSEGGGTDTYARQIMPAMGEELGTNIAIENVPGAASLRGTGQLYNSEPDGATFGGFNPPSTPVSAIVNPPSYEMQQLRGVGTYARTPFVVVINPEHDVSNMADLVTAYRDGTLGTFGGKSKGGVDHVISLLLRDNPDYNMSWQNYVGYDGTGPAVQATISGEIPACISTDTGAEAAVSDGRVNLVTCLSSEGSSVFPDLQSVTDEQLDGGSFPNIDFVGQLRRGMFVPPETPDNVINTLTNALEPALQADRVQNWSDNTGNIVEYGPPDAANSAVQNAFEQIPQNINVEEVRNAA